MEIELKCRNQKDIFALKKKMQVLNFYKFQAMVLVIALLWHLH